METGIRITGIEPKALGSCILEIIAARSSAYGEWNGPRTPEEQKEEAADWLARISGRRNPALFVAKRGPEIAGYVWGNEKGKGEFHISHIGVRVDCQRKGIGRELMRQCEEACRSRSYSFISTSTYGRYRRMVRLLLWSGFCVTGVSPLPPSVKIPENRISLAKSLSSGPKLIW